MNYDLSIHPRVYLESDIADQLANGNIKALIFDVGHGGDEELLCIEEEGLLVDNQISVFSEDNPKELIGVAEFNERISGNPETVYERVCSLLGSKADFLDRFSDCQQIRVYIPEMFFLSQDVDAENNNDLIVITPFDLKAS